jgi:hypothetical protein
MNQIFQFIWLALCINFISAMYSSSLTVRTAIIGDTAINITQEIFPVPSTCVSCSGGYSFLNLHENENTSVTSARNFLLLRGGSITRFSKGNTRYISFYIKSTKYTFDPNRMFTPEGIASTLSANGPYSSEAAQQVSLFANTVLEEYGFISAPVVLALHNNGGAYGAASYLPGGVYANDAEKVNIVAGTNPSDFFYVLDPSLYDTLAAMQYNIVLQNNETVSNDGSLSYYCGLQAKPYVNFESQAEYTGYGQQIVIQLDMIIAAASALSAK